MSDVSKRPTLSHRIAALIAHRPRFSSEILLAAGAGLGAYSAFDAKWWLLSIGSLLILTMLATWRERIFFLAGVVLVGLSAVIQLRPEADDFSCLTKLPAGVTVKLRVTDTRLCQVAGIELPRKVKVQVLTCNQVSSSGTLQLYLKPEMPNLKYGDLVQATGTIEPPGAIFRRYDGTVESTRFREARLFCDELQLLGNQPGVMGYLLLYRDKLIARMTHGIDDAAVRNLAAAFFFGASGGLEPQARADFLASGTVHLFSISGMHVGFLAMILLIFLKPVGFRYRYWVLTLLLTIYVLMTGAGVPALRALVMIATYAILRSLLFYAPPCRTLALTAAGILLVFPQSISSIGFWFSFLITGALLLAGEQMRSWRPVWGECLTWMPYGKVSRQAQRRFRLQQRLIGWGMMTLSAFFAGAGITLYFQHQLLPGSVVANLCLPLLMPVVLISAPLKMTLGAFWAWGDQVLAQVIELFFQLVSGVAGIGAEWFGVTAIAQVSGGIIVVYYLVLFSVWSTRRARWGWYGLAALVIFLSALPLLQKYRSSEITVISGDSTTPAGILISEPQLGAAWMVDPTYEAAGPLVRLLQEKGISRVAEIGFSAPHRSHAGGIGYLNFYLQPERVVIPEVSGRHWSFRRLINARLPEADNLKIGKKSEVLQISPLKNGQRLIYRNPGSRLNFELRLISGDWGREVILIQQDQVVKKSTLPWSSLPREWRYAFN